MKRKILLIYVLTIYAITASAQQKDISRITDSIVNEGKALFRSEWASWYGTDIFLEKCKDKSDQIGGYLSYETQNGLTNVFFSKGEKPVVLGTTLFGNDFNENNYKLDTVVRKLSKIEEELYNMRQIAIKRVNTDTTFKKYKNTSLNPVPIIIKGVKKVYVLTGTHEQGVVIFGNDYLLNFDDDQVVSVNKLHKNIIAANFTKAPTDSMKKEVSAMHSHLPQTGDFITATDICTLMLYEKLTTWQQYYVISKKYVSIWDCKKNDLFVMTMEAWKRIADDQAIRHPKKQ